MKKLTTITLLLAAVLLTCACSADVSGTSQEMAGFSAHVTDFFPSNDSMRLFYQGEGSEYASYTVYTDYAGDGRIQRRIDNSGTTVVQVIRVNKYNAERVFSQGETGYRQNMQDAEQGPPEALLKAPLEEGRTWLLGDGRIRGITGIGVLVETPAGSFDTIEVTTVGPGSKSIDYYARNIGLVKTVYVTEGGPIVSVLSQIEKDVPLLQMVRFYYPNADTGAPGFVDREVNFYTNDVTRHVLTDAYKEAPPPPLGRVFSPGTQINSLYLNKDGMVYIDLNEAFQREMNAGTAYEQMILQSVANTFGRYYGVNRVILTVDGRPYESGHIAMRPGEYLTVDADSTVAPETPAAE